ncbi:MAG: hypothetical protein IIV79_04515, partial [Clostridia bacterium]|nr:hypothetical protein [Clostridia bacterium]
NPSNPSNPSNPGNPDEPTNPGFVMPDRPVDETEGQTYLIIQQAVVENPFGYSQDSQLGMKVQERLDEVMETYGCTIEFEQVSYEASDYASKLYTYEVDERGDLVFADKNAKLRRTLGVGGDESLMVDLLLVNHIINFWDSNKWGTLTARETMMAGGTFYGVTPALWIDCTPLPYYQVVYNKEMVEMAGVTDPQEYWENEEWDRDAMMDVIVGTTNEADGVWGMTAMEYHMIRATFLGTGKLLVEIEKINEDKTVDWTPGLSSPEVVEAFSWLKKQLKNNAKCFNNGGAYVSTDGSWGAHVPFNEGLCAMAMTRPSNVFDSIVVKDSSFPFGIITWASDVANSLTGYYEQVYSVAIPRFAKEVEHSAFLMADLFEGLEGVETYQDVLDYYREDYFDSDIDVECLVRDGAALQYSYWPNGTIDKVWTDLEKEFLSASSVSSLVKRYANTISKDVETHILPNQVALQQWRDQLNAD